jgi:hypothetical protein
MEATEQGELVWFLHTKSQDMPATTVTQPDSARTTEGNEWSIKRTPMATRSIAEAVGEGEEMGTVTQRHSRRAQIRERARTRWSCNTIQALMGHACASGSASTPSLRVRVFMAGNETRVFDWSEQGLFVLVKACFVGWCDGLCEALCVLLPICSPGICSLRADGPEHLWYRLKEW